MPVTTNITGNIVLALQALDNSNNQLLFNRLITGLQFAETADASLTSYYNIDQIPLPLLPDPNNFYPLLGFYCRNKSSVAVVIVTWLDAMGATTSTLTLQPGGMILQFQPSGIGNIMQVMVVSDTDNTPIEYAWWAAPIT